MIYVEALENPTLTYSKSVFLAGGITGCPDWQKELVTLLDNSDLILFNPRRADFPINDPNAAQEQISWEHDYLRIANAISFWFAKDTIQPITLYELGSWSMSDKPIFIGIHPEYPRRQDVEIQTKLIRPEVEIVYSLKELAQKLSSLE